MDKNKTSVWAIIGLIFAIIALLLSAVPIVNNFAFVMALLGLVFGVVAIVGISKGKRSGKGLAIATIVISVIAGVVVIGSQMMYSAAIDEVSQSMDEVSEDFDRMAGDKTEDILGSDVDVSMGEFTVITDEFGFNTTELPVTVTNKLDEGKSYSIHIESVDSEGNRIADDYVYANDLGANQSITEKVFVYIEESKLDAVRAGEFKIVSVSQM